MILDYIYRCVDVPRFSFMYVSYTVNNMLAFPYEIEQKLDKSHFEIELDTLTIFITKTQTKKHIYFRPFMNAYLNILYLVGWHLKTLCLHLSN